MSDAEIQPGWWFIPGGAQVLAATDYHAKRLSRTVLTKMPPFPLIPRKATGAQAAKVMRPWWAKVKTRRLPAPPRKGSVLVPLPKRVQEPDGVWTEDHFYPVAECARQGLALLRRLAEAAGGLRESRLRWVAELYWRAGPSVHSSLAALMRDQRPVIEAEMEVKRARDGVARAAAHNKLAVARSEAKQAARGEWRLGAFCLEKAESASVQSLAVEFVGDYGPLILDFGVWCHDSAYGAFVSRHWATASDPSSWLLFLGSERFLWPPSWRKWATAVYTTLGRRVVPPKTVPPPVGFYVWAAYMLTALTDHPEWPGCQLFLANRLASLRLVPMTWFPELAEYTKPHQGRRVSARLYGELLDYLALAAARQRGPIIAETVILCENCGNAFTTEDGRRRYCDSCSSRQVRDAARARRYRDRRRNELA